MKYFSTLIITLTMSLTGCANLQEHPTEVSGQFTASAQKIAQVQQLEKEGIIKDVVIMESDPAQIIASGPENVMACLSSEGGKWLQEHNECEYMNRNQCESLGGSYNECASACRHDPEAQICILLCVQVCEFKK